MEQMTSECGQDALWVPGKEVKPNFLEAEKESYHGEYPQGETKLACRY